MNGNKIRGLINKVKEILNTNILMYLIIFIAILIFGIAAKFNKYNIMLIAVILIWIYNIIYSLCNLNKRFMFLVMNLMLFTFILSRPVISAIRGDEWWYFSQSTIIKALICIIITQLCLLLGNIIGEKIPQKEIKQKDNNNEKSKKGLQKLLLGLIILTGIVSAYVEISNYINMKDFDYALNYTNLVKENLLIVRILANLYPYCVFAYLATMPNKKNSIINLVIYSLISTPSFLLGSRNSLILKIVFSLIYIIFRNLAAKDDEIWITLKMEIFAVISIPIIIVFLGVFNYTRSDQEITTNNPILIVSDFFYKQGTTFDTICQGFEYEENFKNQPKVISYTFGDIIDYIIHNTISQKIFGTEDLGNGNSMEKVELSNSLAHRLSYVVLGPTSYLSGHGRGTSYIIETYMDAGVIGVGIYSLILGVYLAQLVSILEKENYIINYILLTSLSQIFILPRYSASGFLSFIVTPYFWMIFIIVFMFRYFIILTEKNNKAKSEKTYRNNKGYQYDNEK